MFGIPGINTDPQSVSNWGNRIAPCINKNGDWRFQPVLYHTNEFTVEEHEADRVQTATWLMNAYRGVEAHGLAHSNGTRVLLGGWIGSGGTSPVNRLKLTTVHLLCAACDADCDSNGINAGLCAGTLGDVFIYVAGSDSAMRIEDTMAGKLLFNLPMGHTPLGLRGPENVFPAVADRVHVIQWNAYDHSTCWDAEHFNGTVTQVMTLAELYGKSRFAGAQ